MILSWQQIASPVITEILCKNGDGVVLDTEHGCYNRETLSSCIQVARLCGKQCFVRLTEISNTLIRHCLDSGATGLIFSTIESASQAEKIIEYSCYTPRGNRGLGLVRGNSWGRDGLLTEDPVLIPQIETKTGVDNLDKIVGYNFDYYLIGPYDLSLSLNLPGKFDNPVFVSYINKVKDKIPTDKLAVHIPNNVEQQITNYQDYGLKCLGMDTIALLEYHKGLLKNA